MKRLIIVGVLVVGLVLAGAGWYVNTNYQDAAPDSGEPSLSESPVVEQEQESFSEGGPAVQPLSLIEFSQRDFDGHDFTVGRVLAENEAYTRYYITYLSGELRISGIMNVPKGQGPFPVLILNHGYIDPAIYTNGRGLKREQDYLARRGYVVIHSDYRNHAESDKDPNSEQHLRLGYAEDVINVINAVQKAHLPYIDANRVGMLGHSMGGGVALVVAVTQPDLVDAYVLLAPVSADARDNFERWTERRPEVAARIVAEYGTPQDNPAFWEGVSPVTFFEAITAPVMIHHGTADESVPLVWSERAQEVLKAQGKDSTLYVYDGEPHEFIDAWPQVMQRTVTFFDQHVRQ